jgi:Uncharacterized protein conserved in bacteria (DUF2252)
VLREPRRLATVAALGASLLLAILFAAEPHRPSLADALAAHVSPRELADNPQLLARLRGSAHGYFRFINVPFSQAVCERFADLTPDAPVVNLHGDAHVEQYAVTSLGRGLTDFDDSSTGPYVIDLMRFGVSLHLAARERGWRRDEGTILDAFLRGYRSALSRPGEPPPEPAVAARLRARFTGDHARRLREGDLLMGAPRETSDLLRQAGREYADGILADHPDLPRSFFEIKKSGTLRMGIGSALDRKYLVRVEGPTASDDDDVLIEAKEVKDISMIACVRAPAGADRVLAGHSRIANQPFAFAGFLRVEGRTFWLHAWPDDYVEVAVADLRSVRELSEVAEDAGAQMGRGAPRSLPGVEEDSLRSAIARALDRHEGRIRSEVRAFADATTVAWQRFQRAPIP